MAKVVKFPSATPEKFGPQRARSKEGKEIKPGQLNLFTGGKVVRLNQLGPFDEALLLDEQGDWKMASIGYQKAIDEDDSKADAYCNLGIIEWQRGNFTRAIDNFTLALKFDPRHYEAHYNLANLYAEAGNFSLAKTHYGIAIELEPAFPNSYFNCGLTMAMNKEYKEAVDMLLRYRRLTPREDHTQTDELIVRLQSIY